jgi:hypothetical protein
MPCARQPRRRRRRAPARAARTRWLTADGERDGAAPVPPHYRHVFGQMQSFNRDLRSYAGAVGRRGIACSAGQPAAAAAVREVDGLFRAADWLAVHFRRRVRLSLLCTHALAALMGLCFILFSDIQANRSTCGLPALFGSARR